MLHITRSRPSNFVDVEKLAFNELRVDGGSGQTIGQIRLEDETYSIVTHLCPNESNTSQVIFGSGLDIFVHRLLLLDALSYNSGGLYRPSLVRNIQSKFSACSYS